MIKISNDTVSLESVGTRLPWVQKEKKKDK